MSLNCRSLASNSSEIWCIKSSSLLYTKWPAYDRTIYSIADDPPWLQRCRVLFSALPVNHSRSFAADYFRNFEQAVNVSDILSVPFDEWILVDWT